MDNRGWGLINYRAGDDSFPPSRDVAERWRNFGAASARTRQIAGVYYPEISSDTEETLPSMVRAGCASVVCDLGTLCRAW